MKATQLRIDNLVLIFGIMTPVTAEIILRLSKINENNKTAINLTPIPLTEEWLIDLGAKGRISPLWISLTNLKSELHFECHESGEIVTMLKGDFADLILDRLKYVHELQNLYFALTGTELTIKQ